MSNPNLKSVDHLNKGANAGLDLDAIQAQIDALMKQKNEAADARRIGNENEIADLEGKMKVIRKEIKALQDKEQPLFERWSYLTTKQKFVPERKHKK